MKHAACTLIVLTFVIFAGCARKPKTFVLTAQPTAYGSAIVESSGGKQTAEVGTPLSQPVIVQVNDEQGNAVAGALVVMHGPNEVAFDPIAGLSDSSGQFTTSVSLGTIPGHYQIMASTTTKAGKTVELTLGELALGYQELLGSQLNDQFCARCHNHKYDPFTQKDYYRLMAFFQNTDYQSRTFSDGTRFSACIEKQFGTMTGRSSWASRIRSYTWTGHTPSAVSPTMKRLLERATGL